MTIGIVAAVAVPLLWGHTSALRRHREQRGRGSVITIGDSCSSGTGIHLLGSQYDEEFGGYIEPWKFTASENNDCWREWDTTPGPRYAQENQMESIFLACKGAQAENVKNQVDYINAQHPGQASEKWNNSIIMFTAGASDIRSVAGDGWPSILTGCITQWRCDQKAENQVDWNPVKDNLIDLYTKLATEASAARIRVMGYPRLMQRKGGICWPLLIIESDEHDWIDTLCDALNANIEEAVDTVKARFPAVDIEYVSVQEYMTDGACTVGDAHVNDVEWNFLSVTDASFHPTQKGFDSYGSAFRDSL